MTAISSIGLYGSTNTSLQMAVLFDFRFQVLTGSLSMKERITISEKQIVHISIIEAPEMSVLR
jgi:hypothetical protein